MVAPVTPPVPPALPLTAIAVAGPARRPSRSCCFDGRRCCRQKTIPIEEPLLPGVPAWISELTIVSGPLIWVTSTPVVFVPLMPP